jgi:CubicO group peptidase (beta-lactamase class C family)
MTTFRSLAIGPALLLLAAAASPSSLTGVWEARLDFGPTARGLLTLVRRPGGWSASLAGRSASFEPTSGRVAFRLSDGSAAFAGRLSGDGSIDGFWTQSAGVTLQPYAFRLHVRRVAADEWVGHVVPLEDTLTYYLAVRPKNDGTLGAFLRNPERNDGRFMGVDRIVRSADGIVLQNASAAPDATPVATGTFHGDSGLLSLYFPNAGRTFDFSRAGAGSGFYSRAETSVRYVYHRPPRLDDGWPVDTLEHTGISRSRIERFVQMLADMPDDSVHSSNIHAVLLARYGRLVLEEYFHGYSSDEPHDTRSASKSLTSLLIGAAIEAGIPISLSTKVYTALNLQRAAAADPRRARMTLGDLLTMSPGFDCDDSDANSRGNEDTMQAQGTDPDWYHYTLALPMLHEPGAYHAYCSAAANLAGDVLGTVAHEPLPSLADRLLARPLGIRRYYMNLTPTGEPYVGGGMRFFPRDFMKIGQVILNGGTWRRRRIVSPQWAADSTSPHYELRGIRYGYLWWVIRYPYRGGTVDAFFAGGNGGQIVMGIPKLDLLIAFYGGNYSDRVLYVPQRVLVPTYILPAVAPSMRGHK